MAAIGIICEYNPPHNGHLWHIARSREIAGEDCAVVCVMSANLVQRGDFAMFEKRRRAAAAVRFPGGADLVIELPSVWSCASAARFAEAGVRLLDACSVVTHLSFGSESGDIPSLRRLSDALRGEDFDAELREGLAIGLPFASARQNAADRLVPEVSAALASPNNTLAVEYLSALGRLGSDITPIAVQRFGAGHLDGLADSQAAAGGHGDEPGIASATAIRTRLAEHGPDAISEFVPEATRQMLDAETLVGRAPVTRAGWETAALARLRGLPDEAFELLPDASDGLGSRFRKAARTAGTINELLDQVKCKRYALSRIRRMLMCAFAGITAEMQSKTPPYIRVLAIGTRGAALLAGMKKKAGLPIIVKPAHVRKLDGWPIELFETESRVTDLMCLAMPDSGARRGGQEWTLGIEVIK